MKRARMAVSPRSMALVDCKDNDGNESSLRFKDKVESSIFESGSLFNKNQVFLIWGDEEENVAMVRQHDHGYAACSGGVFPAKYSYEMIAGAPPADEPNPIIFRGNEIFCHRDCCYKSPTAEYNKKSAADLYQKRCNNNTLKLRYGSDCYGQSDDSDFVIISLPREYKSHIKFQKWCAMFATNEYSRSDCGKREDKSFIDARSYSAWERLVVECIRKRFGESIMNVIQGFKILEMDIDEALRENTIKRCEIALQFPCNFTLRKALFAYYQKVAYEEHGEFIDNKQDLLKHMPSGIAEVAKRIFFHDADMDNLRAVYRNLFDAEYPSDIKLLCENRRKLILMRDGKVFASDYSSKDDNSEFNFFYTRPDIWVEWRNVESIRSISDEERMKIMENPEGKEGADEI